MDTTLRISGMTCGNCVKHVKDALEGIEGVTSAHVDLDAGKATVFGSAPTPLLTAAVKDAGYEATTG